MLELAYLIAGAAIGWFTSRYYYRLSKSDFDALRSRFDGLQQAVERGIAQGVVVAERNARGDVTALKPPSAPTEFKVF